MANTIYILGASFSKALIPDMPTLSDLSEMIVGEKLDEYLSLKDIVNKTKNDLYKVDQNYIEVLANIIFSNNLYFSSKEKSLSNLLKSEFLTWIHQKMKDYSKVELKNSDLLNNFIEHLLKERNEIISFNFDLIIENQVSSLDKVRVEYNIRNSEEDLKSFVYTFSKYRSIFLTKLHGSFNWIQLPGTTNYDVNSTEVLNQESMHSEYWIPTFIPMSNSKEYFFNGTLFHVLWKRANQILNECDNIVVIGYGFPETDITNLAFLLQFKNKIKEIVVIDEKNKTNRLRKLFGESKINTQGAINYLNQF